MDWKKALEIYENMTPIQILWLNEVSRLEKTEMESKAKLQKTLHKVWRGGFR